MDLVVFGITGTNGKTTVSYILRNILKTAGKKCDLIGTISHHIGDNKYEAVNTTPGAGLLKDFFQRMDEAGTECLVMEVSSHGLAQGRVDNIAIDFAGFTNLSQDHLDYHKSMEEYYQAKKKLFTISKNANVINIDDKQGLRLFTELPGNLNFSVSVENIDADYYGQVHSKTKEGSTLRFYEKGVELGEFEVKTPGMFSVYNGLLAAGLARAAGISFHHVKEGIETMVSVPGRFEVYRGNRGEMVIVDFAHTPDAIENLLGAALEFRGKGRLICVFGCGGDRDKGKRRKMGIIAGSMCDYVIITSDNPRSEDPEDIASEIEEGVYDTGCDYHVVIDRYQAIKRAVRMCRKGDVVVIAGKGHEAFQIIGSVKRPFCDRQIVKEELEQ